MMQRQVIVQITQRDHQRQNNHLDNQVQINKSISFNRDSQNSARVQANNQGGSDEMEAEVKFNEIQNANEGYQFVINRQQIYQNYNYNFSLNQQPNSQSSDANSTTLHMHRMKGYLQDNNQAQHQNYSQSNTIQEQYWQKYFEREDDSDDSLSDEDDEIASKKVEEIFLSDNQQNYQENIVHFKKILNEHGPDNAMANSSLKKLIELILPNPFHNNNMMQYGRQLRKQSFQKLNRNYEAIIKKPLLDGLQQEREVKVSFNNEVSFKLFKREERVMTLQDTSQIVEEINQIEKRGRVSPLVLMKQWQHYERQPLNSKLRVNACMQQWVFPTRAEPQDYQANQLCYQRRINARKQGQNNEDCSNIFRKVDLKIILLGDRAHFYDEINDRL